MAAAEEEVAEEGLERRETPAMLLLMVQILCQLPAGMLVMVATVLLADILTVLLEVRVILEVPVLSHQVILLTYLHLDIQAGPGVGQEIQVGMEE